MKYIMEHYGTAILVSVTLVALAIVVVGLCTGGFVETQFQNALTSFFTDMKGLAGSSDGGAFIMP